MGFVSLPVIVFLYWLMLHYKKNSPFPKGGVVLLVLAGGASALIAAFFFVAAAVITVCKVFRWQKNKTLDTPVVDTKTGEIV